MIFSSCTVQQKGRERHEKVLQELDRHRQACGLHSGNSRSDHDRQPLQGGAGDDAVRDPDDRHPHRFRSGQERGIQRCNYLRESDDHCQQSHDPLHAGCTSRPGKRSNSCNLRCRTEHWGPTVLAGQDGAPGRKHCSCAPERFRRHRINGSGHAAQYQHGNTIRASGWGGARWSPVLRVAAHILRRNHRAQAAEAAAALLGGPPRLARPRSLRRRPHGVSCFFILEPISKIIFDPILR